MLTGMLALALIAQATISSRLAGYAALGLVIAVVMIALAVQLGHGRQRTRRRGIVGRSPRPAAQPRTSMSTRLGAGAPQTATRFGTIVEVFSAGAGNLYSNGVWATTSP